jgi:hypothetical protein
MLRTEMILDHLKAGEVIIVRAKNGDCIPMFSSKPSAYWCTIGKSRVDGAVVYRLTKRRLIVPVTRGWYTEGSFRFNKELRDERGRFRPRAPVTDR